MNYAMIYMLNKFLNFKDYCKRLASTIFNYKIIFENFD